MITPKVKSGSYKELSTVLNKLNIRYDEEDDDSEWSKADIENKKLQLKDWSYEPSLIPSVVGMSAKDAVFILENRGIKVQISGKGKVTHQSKPAGRKISRGETIVLTLK